MKKLLFSLFLATITLLSSGQNYIDLAKFTYTGVPNINIDNTPLENYTSSIEQTKLLTSIPVKISDSLAFLTGIDFENHTSKLKNIWSPSSMNITTFKVGFNVKHNAKFSGTYLLLPKLASDYGDFSKSFQVGAIALFKYQLNTQTKLIFGNYINTELFGILNVPILGVYHMSKNEKFETDIIFIF